MKLATVSIISTLIILAQAKCWCTFDGYKTERFTRRACKSAHSLVITEGHIVYCMKPHGTTLDWSNIANRGTYNGICGAALVQSARTGGSFGSCQNGLLSGVGTPPNPVTAWSICVWFCILRKDRHIEDTTLKILGFPGVINVVIALLCRVNYGELLVLCTCTDTKRGPTAYVMYGT
ncbi:uncharacterized protein LY79DRAFT_664335 [Colletotrichum navitas]|uniref:Cyanovirin-N domain-containing protein n=1 Tax=Colletotrichum navitas TaxID=681940 RepID=A0AAD8PHK6_9PEZI|nr:uncharacterized protein LY79DRAFT_664335 [Colletotrichum navitas]KAK1558208.1 hypothetical protein LY79DRAFT_664335 [Colletotrichum navitas]